jgi:cyclophilin family peptidyl-prolyl cis-trans isomerase
MSDDMEMTEEQMQQALRNHQLMMQMRAEGGDGQEAYGDEEEYYDMENDQDFMHDEYDDPLEYDLEDEEQIAAIASQMNEEERAQFFAML